MITVEISKNSNGSIYIFSVNNIFFKKKAEHVYGAQPYLATFDRDCGVVEVLVSVLQFQVETLVSLVYECRNNGLPLTIKTISEPAIHYGAVQSDSIFKVPLGLEEMGKLYSEVNLELIRQDKKRFGDVTF